MGHYAGDRVDSALKDTAVVMKELDRSDEAIEAIKSFHHLCPHDSQESLDNVLVELYMGAGRADEEIEILQNKLRKVEEGFLLEEDKDCKVSKEEDSGYYGILGNLAWAYSSNIIMELLNYYAIKSSVSGAR